MKNKNPKFDKVYIVTYQPERKPGSKHDEPISILSVFSTRSGAQGFITINAREAMNNVRDYDIIEENVYIAAIAQQVKDMTDKQIDDKVDLWHTGVSKFPLHEFLGMTWDEYKVWVKDPEAWRNENKKSPVARNRKPRK